jgi:hypothetical protein
VGTAFYYCDAQLLFRAAAVLGRETDARRYARLAEEIKAAFRREFYRDGNYDGGTQFSNALPLVLGLAAPEEEARLLDNILRDLDRRQGHFNVGVLGARYLLEALSMHRRADAAFALATKTGYPSWAHMLEGGRTTLSEFWDLRGSHNHVMMGSVDGWFYKILAGIQPDEDQPGFEHLHIRPVVPRELNRVRASIETVRGNIAVSWDKQGDSLSLKVRVPANSSATVHVPSASMEQTRCSPARRAQAWVNGRTIYRVGSGEYEFLAPLPRGQDSRVAAP